MKPDGFTTGRPTVTAVAFRILLILSVAMAALASANV